MLGYKKVMEWWKLEPMNTTEEYCQLVLVWTSTTNGKVWGTLCFH